MTLNRRQTRDLALAGLLLAIGLVLPFFTGQIPQIGRRLLPLHLPVLLCGLLCGWRYGLAVGAVLPLLRSLLFGMPPMMPTAVAMAFELAAYGAVAALVIARLPRRPWAVYAALLAAMVAGRVVWGVASWVLYRLMGNAFGWQVFLAGALVDAVPGIIVQLVLIPALVLAAWKISDRRQTA